MNIDLSFAWLSLLLLGAFHGINPGMGWLFAVALGLQERRRASVWRALPPLALGHALAVGGAILLAGLAGLVIPLSYLKWIVVCVLMGMGVFHLVRHRHPRFGGMQVGARDLTIWSFLMASAHGAGFMVLPFLFGSAVMPANEMHHDTTPAHAMHVHGEMPAPEPAMGMPVDGEVHGSHAAHAAGLLSGLPDEPVVGFLAALVHTIGYLLVIGLVATIVYEKLGLRLLRTAWINLDLIWAGSLIATAFLILII